MSQDILDLRDLADEYQAEIDDDPSFAVAHSKYSDLCAELGIERTPSALRGYADAYDPTLIAVADFKEYAQDLAEDIGAIDPDAGWPTCCIDWEQAACELAMDYTLVRYDGIDYYTRP